MSDRPEIPYFQIRWLVDRLHVSTPDVEIDEMIRERVAKTPKAGRVRWTDELVDEAVEYAVNYHQDNRDLYTAVTSGRI